MSPGTTVYATILAAATAVIAPYLLRGACSVWWFGSGCFADNRRPEIAAYLAPLSGGVLATGR